MNVKHLWVEIMGNEIKHLAVGITGASGAVYGVRLLEALAEAGVQTHLMMTKAAALTVKQEVGLSVSEVQAKAAHSYAIGDVGACTASGSFKMMGMVVAPCSMKTLAEIALGYSANLLSRTADVMLKERRRLILLPRETPLTSVHLRHMVTLSDMGAVIAPPVPAFYSKPEKIDDLVNHTVARVLDMFDLEVPMLKVKRWQGLENSALEA